MSQHEAKSSYLGAATAAAAAAAATAAINIKNGLLKCVNMSSSYWWATTKLASRLEMKLSETRP